MSILRRLLVHAPLFGAVLICHSAIAQAPRVRGSVFIDANGNGRRDAGERGAGGVSISNQADVVLTDPSGEFDIAAGQTGIVFVSIPTDYRSGGQFWRPVTSAPGVIEFALVPQTQPRSFSFIHASDPHIAPAVVDRYRHFRSMADSLKPAFVLMGGDLIRDAMSQQEPVARGYFDLFVAETKPFSMPVWTVPGNHDHFGIIPSRSHADFRNPMYNRGMYRQYFGPDYYSFDYGGVHFIGLNSISADDSAYYGDIDSTQLAWLTKDLAHVAAATPIVTFNHIPLVSGWESLIGYSDDALVASTAIVNGKRRYRHTVNNVMDVLELMRGHRYPLALGSHMHVAERHDFISDSMRVRFETSAAIVGGQSVGPLLIPSGFTLYTVRSGDIDAGRFFRLDPPGR